MRVACNNNLLLFFPILGLSCIYLSVIFGIVLCALKQVTSGQSEDIYTCDDKDKNLAICECKNDVCYFKLSIEQLKTFTAYKKDVPMGTFGRLFYINDSNQLQSTLQDKAFLPCNSRNRDICTEPNTADGSTFRSFISVNKRMPGPTIIVNEGATVLVDVFNYLVTEGTSIHWHGMHQRGTPWMDGVGFISQCPIQAGTSFRYIFKAAPSGTFWYHSHSGAQRSDGLFGALIVKEDKIKIPSFLHNVLDTPRYHSITLIDWDRVASVDIFVQTHPNIGIFEGVNLDEVPKDETKIYSPTCTIDGAELYRYYPILVWAC